MNWMVLLLLTPVPVLAPGDQSPPAGLPRSATPSGNPGSWVTTQDYPAEALRANAEGVTEFLLTIGPDGTVSNCEIKSSSGSPLLDATTCQLILRRARFSPARDPFGVAVKGTYFNRVRWTIPRPPPPPAGELTTSFLVSPDGSHSDCRVETASGAAVAMVANADPCQMARGYSRGFVDQAGKPVARRVRSTVKIEILPVP